MSIETTAYKPVKLEASCTVMLLPVVSLYDPRCKAFTAKDFPALIQLRYHVIVLLIP